MKTLRLNVFIYPVILIVFLTFVSILLSPISAQAQGRPKGHLFIIGGGDRSEDMMKRFVALALKAGQGRIVVLPMASSTPEETGQRLVEEFQNLGAKDAVFYNFTRREAEDYARARWLAGSGGIFFSGGDQSRITAADVLKRALVNLGHAGLGDFMMVPVHDEVVMAVPRADAEEIKHLTADTMVCTDFPLVMPAVGDFGESWADAK